jgi:hypothetical protein
METTSNSDRPAHHIQRQLGAWYVVVCRRGRIYQRYFADAVWGGAPQALVAAQRFRDQLLERIPPDTRVRRRIPKGVRKPTTDVVGVTLEKYRVEGREYERYIGTWKDAEGSFRRRRFSVGRYGRKGAYDRALRARKEGVALARAERLSQQREEAARRLAASLPMPRPVKDPRSRKGISMANRRPRHP